MARSIYCSTCRNEKEAGRDNESCCKKCKSDAGKKKRLAKRLEKGLRPLGFGRKPECYHCGGLKENPKAGYCNKCARERDNEWRIRTNRTKKHRTGLCPCGNERAPYSKSYCRECLAKRDKERKPRNIDQIARYNAKAKEKRKMLREPRMLKQDKINIERRKKYSDPSYLHAKLKHQVRSLTRGYIKMGFLVKGSCEICGRIENVEAHHDDYTKPMDIRWLCMEHHREHHKLLKESN